MTTVATTPRGAIYSPELEAAKVWRKIPAARKRAALAKARADRTGTREDHERATELLAGVRRLESEYRGLKAEAAA
jgi:hypothetical protein